MATKSSPGQKYTEESFGERVTQVPLSKGSIEIFGETYDGKLGGKPTSVNQKTGYPGNQKA
jgi:hypothetical protein